ncbi:helicase senataxin-like, partial [Homarus americanus]
MDLFLLRLGTGEKYTLNPDKKRFLIGRNNSCDFTFTSPHISRKHCEILRVPPRGTLIIKNLKGSNTTYIDELQLKSVDNFAELRIGCKIGLGVPLSQTQGDGNEKLQQHLADLSYSGPSAAVQDSIPHADPQKCGPAQQAGPQNQTMPGVRLTPQPGPARQAIQELPGLLNLLKSHTNVTSDSAPTSLLQNTDTKPFTSTPLPQVIHPIPPLQKLHPSTYQSLSWAQNRIQEPLSELHLQSTYNEDHSHTDRQRLHSVNTPSAAPNNVQPAKTFGGAPYKSELWEKVDALKATHSEYNPQPGLCQVQRDQQVCETSHGPCKRILSKKDHDESVPGKLQRLGAVYGDYVGTSQQNNSKQINLLNSQLKEGGADPSQLQVFNRSALGEYTQTQKPDNKSRHQGEGPGAVMCEHSLGMEHLGNTHSSDHHQSVPLMLSSSVEKRLQSPMEDGNQQEKVSVSVEAPQSVCSLLTESGSSQSPSRIFSQFKQTSEDSRVALSLNKDLAPLVHVSNWKQIRRHSRDVLPQSVIPDDSQIEHTSQHGNGLQTTKTSEEFNLIIQQSSSKLKVISEKKLALNCSNIDQTTKVQQFSSSTRRDSMTDKLVSSNVSSCNIDPNCKQSVVDSCDKQDAAQLNMSLEQQAVVTQEKQRDLFNKSPVFTRKDNKHYIIEDNNKQTNRNLAALPLGSQQFSNVDTRSKESCNPADGLVSPCSIDLTQTDPEHTEESDNASDDNIENWIHNKDKHVKYENVDDIVFICDSKEDSSSVENQNFSGKRNITIHEEINVDDDSNKGQHSESIKSESDVQVVDLGSTCDSELLLQHRKTKKRSLVINSDSSSDSFSVEKKDFSGKRKRSIHEEIYVDFCDIDSNKGHHSSSECKELKKHKENKSINLVKGSQGKDKEDVTDSKKHITGRKHRQSDSYDSSDTKQDKDVHKYKKQTLCSTRDIPEKKNPSTMGTEKNDPPSDKGYSKSHSVLSCTSTGTGIDNISENLSMPSVSRKTKISESEPTVLRTRGEQDAVSDATCPNVFDKSKLLLNVAIKQEKTEEAQVKDIKIKKEKGEEDGVLIKKEKGEEDGVLIKKEFDQNLNAVDEDGDNDGVIFMYSQVDETIWVSSDEEESPSQNDISFGPLPRSPDLDIDELFREDEEQKLRQNASGISTNSTPEEAVTDDQWFPILSQSFFDDDDDFVNQPVESAKGPALPEPLPGPSGLNEMTEDNDESIGEWWPELSQQFFDDDLDNSKIHGASKSDVTLSGSSKNLDTVIEKLRNTNKRRSQLTDPKLPPTRTKSDNLRRRGKSCQEFYGKHYRYNEDNLLSTADRRDETGVRGERISRERKSRKDSSWKRVITPPQKQKCKKGSALRANLTSKFNLVSYKATVEHKPREKHHLVPKIKVENKEKKVEEKQKEAHQKKREAHQKKSHLVTDRPRAGENISIQKKTERKDSGNQEKPRPKVAAKVTKKTRSERLIDVDLFTALAVPTPKPQKLSFKIPKNCDKTVDKMIKSLSGSVSAPSTSVGSSLVLVKPSAGELDTNPPPRVEPEMRVGTENIDGDTTLLLQPPVLKEQIVNKSEKEQKDFIEIGTGSLKFWKLKMFTLITQDQSFKGQHPRQGSLISLRIQEGAKKIHIFGHVDHFMKHRKVMVTKELQQACPNGEVCLMMGVRVTKDVIQKATNGKLIMISNVSYIRPSTRMWEGLCKLPLSPLCEDILQPSKDVFMGDRMFDQYLVNGLHLNDVQKKAVVEVSNKCVSNYHIPKMSLIHGPPGTGKTRTIVGLIAQMVQLCCENGLPVCRILLCAPSNAAVDELTLRLIRLREIGICLRVVRVCSREVINPEIKNCTLDSFVEKQIKVELSTPQNPSTKQEWERRKAIVEEAATSLQNAMKGNRSKEEIRQMEIRLTELVRSRTDFERSFHTQPTAQEKHQLQQKWQQKILLNAEVITTTLGGCLSGIMSDVFCKKPNNFTCCIIDEAGQCKETETWLPLLLGVRKLVLVGDHRQLPATVLSRLAQVKNLKQSLFERLYHRFVIELQLDSCVHTLSIQYRMHPEIAMWPSLHFYSGRLTTSADIIQERTSDLKPYVVFDLK